MALMCRAGSGSEDFRDLDDPGQSQPMHFRALSGLSFWQTLQMQKKCVTVFRVLSKDRCLGSLAVRVNSLFKDSHKWETYSVSTVKLYQRSGVNLHGSCFQRQKGVDVTSSHRFELLTNLHLITYVSCCWAGHK